MTTTISTKHLLLLLDRTDSDRVAWSVGRPVSHTSEPYKNGSTNRDTLSVEDSGEPREPRIRWVTGCPDPPMGMHNFEGRKGEWANTSEASVCGGDAVLCQITLISCY